MKIARKLHPLFPGSISNIKSEVKTWLSYEREKCVFRQLISNISEVYFGIKIPWELYWCFILVFIMWFYSDFSQTRKMKLFLKITILAKSFILFVWLDSECTFIHLFKSLFSDYMKRRRSTYRRHHEQVNTFKVLGE